MSTSKSSRQTIPAQPNYGDSPWYGFNFQWIFREDHETPAAIAADQKALDAIADWGFNFVRVPADYRFWASPETYKTQNDVGLELIDGYLEQCQERGLHMSLNLHRVPGYCINGQELERRNLWDDEVAQEGLYAMWRDFAERYRDVPANALSFDLINELPSVGDGGFTRDVHQHIIRRIANDIRDISPDRVIVIDGLDGGNTAIPELADVSDVQSGRGYAPHGLSHFGADWWDIASGMEPSDDVRERLTSAREEWWQQQTGGIGPDYPGEFHGQWWDRDALRDHYAQWEAVERGGSRVHIGEMGCYRRLPNDTALRWMADTLEVFAEHRWGWALWNFEGPFGLVNTGRTGAHRAHRNGYDVDIEMLDLLIERRVDGNND
ncbi:glycoside hydrolase family 5 protein [Demequina aurantiaca]|uniref:glycoside hydrolase family 5 protein n=1 Tax=Demequina aurantiaca TaxID=676200 RepID=UPI000784DE12|nr:cellulase family glycosylhydrolase [Demequina aurantiaca]